MEERIQNIEREIDSLKERNARVEADKAWETSWFRLVSIIIITYVIAALVMYFIGAGNIFLNALVPTVGFFLSTLTLPVIKKWWINKLKK